MRKRVKFKTQLSETRKGLNLEQNASLRKGVLTAKDVVWRFVLGWSVLDLNQGGGIESINEDKFVLEIKIYFIK